MTMATEPGKEVSLPMLAIRLRALVLALGECVRPAWWTTAFMSETGFRFLERLYPRSYFSAAVHAAGKAACEVHDRAVGRVGVYHLFRLSEALEADIYAIAPSMDEDSIVRFRSCLGQTEKLMEMLRLFGNGEALFAAGPGPRRIGTEADLTEERTLSRVAATYFMAFKQGKPAFPYLSAEPGEPTE